MPFEPGILNSLYVGNPSPDVVEHDQTPATDDQECHAPGDHRTERSTQWNSEKVGDGHSGNHDRDGLGTFPFVGQFFSYYGCDSEIGPVG